MIDFRDLIGIPFKADSNNQWGIDCFNLMRAVHKKYGYNIPSTNIAVCASREISNKEIQRKIIEDWQKIEKPQTPCGVLIASSDPRFAHHIATYIGDNRILHITKNTNSMVERLFPKYKTRVLGFYKYIGDNQVNG